MRKLQIGEEINLLHHGAARVEDLLYESRSSCLYSVENSDCHYMLKWYKGIWERDPYDTYERIQENADAPTPSKRLLWPIDITDYIDKSFGYMVNLPSHQYYPLSKYSSIASQWAFPSYKAAIKACMQIVSTFYDINKQGYVYRLHDDIGILINQKTGDVLICDNEGISKDNAVLGDFGSKRYLSPELLAAESLTTAVSNSHDENQRDIQTSAQVSTDFWSLSVVLFMILCMGHPLEGERWLVPLLNPKNEKAIYGYDATFIYDQTNDSNRPNPKAHANVIARWDKLPPYMKEAFSQAFSKDAILNPANRLREIDWLKLLARFQGEIRRCQKCGSEVFVYDESDAICNCGEQHCIERRLCFNGFSMSASENTLIYRCMLESCKPDDALIRIGTIVTNPSRPGLYFRNDTDLTLDGRTAKGTIKAVTPNSVVPLKPGIAITSDYGEFTIG